MTYVWEETSYRDRYLNVAGRIVGKVVWAFVADHWRALDCRTLPYKYLGTWTTEDLAKAAVMCVQTEAP